jgi:photoactive yellow protein
MRRTKSEALAGVPFEAIEKMDETELDHLPFGAIQLDGSGTILTYNLKETEISGRSKEAVLGKNFFTEVAPCTNVQKFAGRFREGVAAKSLNVVFPYRFDFKMVPRDVTITLFYSVVSDTAWVFVVES